MVSQSILFAINTTGSGKAKLAFAAVAAGVFLVARKLNAIRKVAEEFDQTFSRLTDTQREAVRAMESATKGLVDTKVEMDSVVKMTEAANGKWKVTPKIMKSIGVMAADMAQKLGEGPEGVTRRVNQLTEALSKGTSRALKPYGVEIEKEGTLLEMQQEGIRKVIGRAEGLTVSVTTLTEQTFALNNNWETFLGLMIGSAGTIDVIGNLNFGLGTLNDSLMSTDDGFAEATLSFEQFDRSLAAGIFEMFGFTEQAWKMNSQLGLMIENQGKLKQIQAKGKIYREQLAYVGTLGPEEAKVIQSYVAAGGDAGEAIGLSQEMEKERLRKMTQGGALAGRGGGAKAAPALVGEEKWAAELALDQARKEEQIAHNEWRLANDDEYLDRMIAQEMEAEAELQSELQEMYTVSQEKQAQWEIETQEDKWAKQLEMRGAERELETEHHEWRLENDALYAEQQAIIQDEINARELQRYQQHVEQKMAKAQYGMGMMSSMAKNMSSLMQTENKKQFEVGKKFAYASAVMDTAMGSAAAIAGGIKTFGIPWGLVAGLAAAATVTAAGAVQIKTIHDQKFGTGGGGVSAGSVGSTGGGYLGGGGNYAAGGPGGAQTTHINIQIGEEDFADFFYSMNDAQSQKGNPKAFVTESEAA